VSHMIVERIDLITTPSNCTFCLKSGTLIVYPDLFTQGFRDVSLLITDRVCTTSHLPAYMYQLFMSLADTAYYSTRDPLTRMTRCLAVLVWTSAKIVWVSVDNNRSAV